MENDNVTSIVRGNETFNALLKQYEHSPGLRNFLNAFEVALGHPLLMDALVKAIRVHSISMHSEADINRAQNLIARVNFRKDLESKSGTVNQDAVVPSSASATLENKENNTLKDVQKDPRLWTMEEFESHLEGLTTQIKWLDEYRQALLHEESPYYFFIPAMEIAEHLERDFDKSLDPGRWIANYARAAFSRPSTKKPSSHVATTKLDKATLACLALLVEGIAKSKPMGFPYGGKSQSGLSEGMQHALIYLLGVVEREDTESMGDDDSDESSEVILSGSDLKLLQIFNHSYELTQDLFDCVLLHLFESPAHRAKSALIFYMLTQLPFDGSYVSLEEFKAGTDEILASKLNDGMWERKWHKLPYMRWIWAENLFDEIFRGQEEGFAQYGYAQLMNKYLAYRSRNGGYSPLGVEETAELWASINFHVPKVKQDPILVIGSLYDISLAGQSKELGCNWLHEDEGSTSSLEPSDRSRLYLAISENAYSEGMSEFGAALLGFYLYSQSLLTDSGLHADMALLTRLIDRGLDSPGKHLLERCIELAESRLGQVNAPLEAMVLTSYLRPRATLISFNPGHERAIPLTPERAIVRSSLQAKYPMVFKRFHRNAQDLLIDAEIMWAKMHSEFGSGIGDWGALGVALTKPLEVELVARLEPVYTSDAYKLFHKERFHRDVTSKATLGAIVHMLKSHQLLPDSVKAGISKAGVTLPIELKLLRALEKSLSYRNKGAHSDPFTEIDYLSLRKALFDENGLETLAESLTAI